MLRGHIRTSHSWSQLHEALFKPSFERASSREQPSPRSKKQHSPLLSRKASSPLLLGWESSQPSMDRKNSGFSTILPPINTTRSVQLQPLDFKNGALSSRRHVKNSRSLGMPLKVLDSPRMSPTQRKFSNFVDMTKTPR